MPPDQQTAHTSVFIEVLKFLMISSTWLLLTPDFTFIPMEAVKLYLVLIGLYFFHMAVTPSMTKS